MPRLDFVGHQAAHELGERRLRGDLVDVLVAGEKTEVGKSGVAAVEQAQLHSLEGRYVANELRADAMPAGAARDKLVFDRPLPERLVHDGCGIVNP